MDKVNLLEKFGLFSETWSPKIAGELNGQEVKLVKLKGTFVWHQHEDADELFLVVQGKVYNGIQGSNYKHWRRRVPDRAKGY